jgi:hypothetical protein
MDLKRASIETALKRRAAAYEASSAFPVPLTLVKPADFLRQARPAIQALPSIASWSDAAGLPQTTQADLWLLREWLNANVLLFAATAILSAQQSGFKLLRLGGQPRRIPAGFSLRSYKLYNFGSSKLTSDIDINIEGPHASFLCSVLEDSWILTTGKPCAVWDIEYYGDFLMFQGVDGEPAYLNSRQFAEDATGDLLAYAGVSLLRNRVSLNAPEIREFLERYPELNGPGWAERATELFQTAKSLDYDERRELYYTELAAAERLRDVRGLKPAERHLRVFLELCKANIYRSENYILPSTVIHIVRDVQAGSPPPEPEGCEAFTVRLASCALGRTTYLLSALEQLGYMIRFRSDPAKEAKYKKRYDDALAKAAGDDEAINEPMRIETPPPPGSLSEPVQFIGRGGSGRKRRTHRSSSSRLGRLHRRRKATRRRS